MAGKNEVKVKFTADTKGFNDAIKQANSTLTTLRSELRLNKTQADAAGDSIENLADRQRILGDELQASQSKITALTNKLDAARDAFGDGSVEVQKLQTQLNNAATAQTRIQQELTATTNALNEMQSESTQTASALDRLEANLRSQESALSSLKDEYNRVAAEQGEASDEARQLAQQIQRASSEVQQSRDSFNQANSAADKFDRTLDDLGDSAKDTGSDFGALDVAIGDFASDIAQNAIGSLTGLEESTRQYRNEQSKLEAVAQQSGQSLEALKTGYETLYSITGDETLASTAVLNMSAMGMSVEAQQSIIQSATGAWAAYGDSIQLDGLLESINETTRAGQVTGSFADALNWARMSSDEWSAALSGNSAAQAAFNKGISEGMSVEDAFNEALLKCNDTQERQQLVTDALNAAYGELGSTYQETNADVMAANDAQSRMNDAMASLGEAIAPITTGFQNLVATGLQWIADNLPIVVPLVTGLAVGIGGLAIVSVVSAGFTALAGVLGAIASPVLIVVGVIAALAAGFMALWQNSETFRNGVMQVWTTIQTVFGTLAEWFMTTVVTPVVTYFQSLWPTIQAIFTQIQTLISTVMTVIGGFIQQNMGTIQAVWNAVWGAISAVASTVWTTIQTVINTALGVIQGVIQTVTAIISGDWEGALNGIASIAESVWNGISGLISGIINGIADTISSVLDGISASVSGALDNISGFFSDNFGAIGDTVSSVIDGARDVVKNGLDAISGFFSGLHIEFPKIKLPHFSISGSFSLMPPSVPSIGISWYAKGGILEQPTIFGAAGGNLLAGGEAGPEAVAPIGDLLGYMIEALDAKFGSSDASGIIDAIEDLADRVISIEIDGKQLARATASDADRVNGSRQNLVRRGVALP